MNIEVYGLEFFPKSIKYLMSLGESPHSSLKISSICYMLILAFIYFNNFICGTHSALARLNKETTSLHFMAEVFSI